MLTGNGRKVGEVGMKEYIVRYENEYLQLLPDKMQELVRCKDCKECYFASNRIQSEQTFACGKYGIDVTPDWFCADGGRQEGR